jgi:hypothetical protein
MSSSQTFVLQSIYPRVEATHNLLQIASLSFGELCTVDTDYNEQEAPLQLY